MFIFKFFKIKALLRGIKEDTWAIASEETLALLIGLVVVPITIASFAMVMLFVLGFTELIYKSFVFAKILFYILLPFYLLALFLLVKIYRKIKYKIKDIVYSVRKNTGI